MPVGVPKVPYFTPGDEDGSWVELYNRLYHERLFFLSQELKSEVCNQLAGLMVYFSIEDKTKDLYLFINSPGGDIISGMGVFDAMCFVEAEVQTVCVGVAASMASFLLSGGTVTKRLAFPHSRVMMHQPASSFQEAQTGESMLDANELLKMREIIVQFYVERTGKPSWEICRDMERDNFMSAEEAQAYGIVDMVANSTK